MNLQASYKNVDLALFFQGVHGGDVWDSWIEYSDFWNIQNVNNTNHLKGVFNAWSPQNPDSNIPALSTRNTNDEKRTSTYFLKDGSYLKLRTIELGYTFPESMVKKAMIYPIAVCVVAVIVTIVMLVVVIPNYEDMFKDLGTELPWITQFYVNLSHGIINYWFIIIPVIIALVFAIRAFAKTDAGKHFFGKIALKAPLFGKLTTKSASSMMARTMSTLLGAGVPLIEAVEIVSGVMSNVYFKEAMEDAKEEITIGMPLSRPLRRVAYFLLWYTR